MGAICKPPFSGSARTPTPSDHYLDGRFFNPGVRHKGFLDLLKWITHRRIGPWRHFLDSPPGPRPPERVPGRDLRVTFVNHSTVLLQTEGLNLLTDPVWSQRTSPVQWIGPRRHRNPGILFADLPPIDAVLISHDHYDHLDKPTLRRLLDRGQPAVFCPLGVGRLLRKIGFQEIHELDWWEHRLWGDLRVHCTPAQHFSGRAPWNRNRTLWCGWLLECISGNIYFAGDSAACPHFAAIAEHFPELRFALLPVGAYKPEWFMEPVHLSPDQTLEVHATLGAPPAIAIHYGTFALADDGETEAVDRLAELIEISGSDSFWIAREGEGFFVP
ncbi:MAG TPA: MBL fold metallo-hydrolase [Acidobacteriaceae bacterium]|nr:MBL fold metallo-hydrolase [Acidobacteriaceae bacterium]